MSETTRKRESVLATYGRAEETANAVTHGLGALLSILGSVLLILRGMQMDSTLAVVCAALYGGSLILLYTASCLYHALTAPLAKKVFRVLDHSTIFLLILGTYIPISLVLIGGAYGWILFGVNTAIAVLGITLTAVDMERWKKLCMALYVAMGWMVVLALGAAFRSLSVKGLILLFAGGAAYTGGIWFYRKKDRPWTHCIWHIFVLAGSFLHYLMVYSGYTLS